jgi:hypothetical protein
LREIQKRDTKEIQKRREREGKEKRKKTIPMKKKKRGTEIVSFVFIRSFFSSFF